jgi:hypothetical protein
MRFTPSSTFALLTVAFASVHALPLRAYDDNANVVARSMLGSAGNAVSWNSLPLERSPSDPDFLSDLEKRIVYNPHITYPAKSTVWTAGEQVQVMWDVDEDSLPESAKGPNASVMLGYLKKGDSNEHLGEYEQRYQSNSSLK